MSESYVVDRCINSLLLPSAYIGGRNMSEEEVIEKVCKNCTKEECEHGIKPRIDGTYHCADGE